MASKSDLVCPQCQRRYAAPADRCAADGAPLYGPEVMGRIGQEITSYKIHGILGEGGMGVVYKAEHIMLQKPVAMKVLHERFAKRKGAANQFLREARAASRVRHPHICDVTDFGEAPDGSLFFVMELLEGESLEDVLARDGRLPVLNAVNVVNQIARALGAAADFGIVHQDLKPDNIYLISREGRRRIVRRTGESFVVEPEGKYDFVKLLDFGVAKFAKDELGPGLQPKAGMVFGTPHYMSPEQAQGLPVDQRSDVYSLGILFYEMLLGVVPFDFDRPIDILNGHVSGTVHPPMHRDPTVKVDEATNTTIMRCLEKDPERRFQSMDDLRVALRDCFTDRVYLRDAHRLPGAIEAGIAPPPVPPAGRPESPTPIDGAQLDGAQLDGAQLDGAQLDGAQLNGARLPVTREEGRPKRLSEELAELFGRPEQATPAPATPARDAKTPPPGGKPARHAERTKEDSGTRPGLGAVKSEQAKSEQAK